MGRGRSGERGKDQGGPDIEDGDRAAGDRERPGSKPASVEWRAPGHAAIVVEVTRNEAAPAADTASTGCHRVTRCWFLRRFTAVAYLWRPTFAWAVGGPGRFELAPTCDGGETVSRGLFSPDEVAGAQSAQGGSRCLR